MKTTLKKRLSACLAMLLVISTLLGSMPAAAAAKSGAMKVGSTFTSGQYKYKVTALKGKSGNVSLLGAKNKSITSVTIPNTVKSGKYKFKVTAIADKAFKGYKKLKVVNTNKNLKTIGSNAFNGCKKLEKVNIKGTNVTSVGKNALKGISKNAVIQVPEKKKSAYAGILKNKGQSSSVKVAAAGSAVASAPQTEAQAAATQTEAQAAATQVFVQQAAPVAAAPQTVAQQAAALQTEAKTETPKVTVPETEPEDQAAETEVQAAKAQETETEAQKTEATEEETTEAQTAGTEVQTTEATEEETTEAQAAGTEAQPTEATEEETTEAQAADTEAQPTETTEEETTEAQAADTEVQPTEATEEETTEAQAADTEAQTTEVPQHEHNYEWKVTEETSCWMPGIKTGTCRICGEQITEEIAQLEHEEVLMPRKEATCTTWGHTEYTECGKCGCHLRELEFIEPLGHDYQWETTVSATCVAEGRKTGTCERCGDKVEETLAIIDHTFTNWETVQEPTCALPKVEKRTCTMCGKTEYRTTASDIQHVYDPEKHYVKEPSCEQRGEEHFVCKVCGQDFFHYTEPAIGSHDFEDTYTIDKAATEEEEGSMSRHCTRCGAVTDVQTIPKLEPQPKETEHEHVFSEWEKTADPTCNASGVEERRCECGKTETRPIPANLNDHHLVSAGNDIPATCESWGKTNRKKCTVCGQEFFSMEKPLGHKFQVTETKEATCTEDGFITRTCETCGKVETEITSPKTGHTWTEDAVVLKEATCSEFGRKGYECTTCGETRNVMSIEKKPHNYTKDGADNIVTQEATCTEDGYKALQCVDCGYEKVIEVFAHTGHRYTEEVIEKEASCTEAGAKRYDCEKCGAKGKTVTIPALGHKFGECTIEVPAESCKELGKKKQTCSECGEKRTISYLGEHSWDENDTCAECGKKKSDVEAKNLSSLIWFVQYEVEGDSRDYCVGFDGNGTSFTGKISTRADNPILVVAPAAKEGYHFKEWQIKETAGDAAAVTYRTDMNFECTYLECMEKLGKSGSGEKTNQITLIAVYEQNIME